MWVTLSHCKCHPKAWISTGHFSTACLAYYGDFVASLACETVVLGTNCEGGLYGLHVCNVLYDADKLIMAEFQEHVKQTQVQQLSLSAATCLISTDVKCLYGKH